jgi:hypothetical protein
MQVLGTSEIASLPSLRTPTCASVLRERVSQGHVSYRCVPHRYTPYYVYLIGVYIISIYFINIHLLGVYIINVHHKIQLFLLSNIVFSNTTFLILALS